MTALHTVLAKDADTKTHLNRVVTDFYHVAQKNPLFNGMVKTYQPKAEDGDLLPAESVLVQKRVTDVVKGVREAMATLFDLRATIDMSNIHARAAVEIDGSAVTDFLPTTHLLFLQKQINDLHTIVSALPTLDPAQVWHFEAETGLWSTEELKTSRTVKKEKFVTVAPATDKHPAQVAKTTEDVQEGWWTTRKLSGAIPATEKAALLARIAEVKTAVKVAITQANSVAVTDGSSSLILRYIFGM